jgi:hypothetical protein
VVKLLPEPRQQEQCSGREGDDCCRIGEATVLVLLMAGIYEECRSGDLRWHDVRTKFHED